MNVYNTQRHIRRAIGSILEQSFADFEYLMINYGSTDTTSPFWPRRRPPIRKWTSFIEHANVGLTIALRTGCAHARSEYIAWQTTTSRRQPSWTT
jgi:glycosyltransferase involved in cell wall biosynthesis